MFINVSCCATSNKVYDDYDLRSQHFEDKLEKLIFSHHFDPDYFCRKVAGPTNSTKILLNIKSTASDETDDGVFKWCRRP